MTNQDRPLIVTGDERSHPAVRLLARACIALAQERLAEQKHDATEVKDKREREATAKTLGTTVVKKAAKKTSTPKPTDMGNREGTKQ